VARVLRDATRWGVARVLRGGVAVRRRP
jgi:hypothetical protein